MSPQPNITGCFPHFRQRVHERLGPNVDADKLWRVLIQEVRRAHAGERSDYLKCFGRINREGRRLWRVRTDHLTFFVIFDDSIECPITVLPPKGMARRWGLPPFNLEEMA